MSLLATVPSINPMYRFQWEPAQDSHVLLYPEGMIQLNGSASEILKRVNGEDSIAEIIATLEAQFEGVEGLADDVVGFFEHAVNEGWVNV